MQPERIGGNHFLRLDQKVRGAFKTLLSPVPRHVTHDLQPSHINTRRGDVRLEPQADCEVKEPQSADSRRLHTPTHAPPGRPAPRPQTPPEGSCESSYECTTKGGPPGWTGPGRGRHPRVTPVKTADRRCRSRWRVRASSLQGTSSRAQGRPGDRM